MKKIIIALMVATGVYGCASTNSSTTANNFTTDNYQKQVVNSVDYVDNFANFESRDYPEATLEASDMTKLMQADMAFNQGIYQLSAPMYYELAEKYKDPRIIYKGILSYQSNENAKIDAVKLNYLVTLLISVAPDSEIAKLYAIPASLNSDNYSSAVKDLDSLISANKEHAGDLFLFTTTLLSAQNYAHSNQSMAKFADYVADEYAKYPEALLLASIAYNNAGENDKLLSVLNKINNKYPTWEFPVFWNAGIVVNANNTDLLEKIVQQDMANRKNPSDNMENLYVAVFIKLNQLESANQYILSSPGYQKQRGNMLVNSAVIDYKLGGAESAVKQLSLAQNNGYDLNGAVSFALGALSANDNKPQVAIKYFESAASTNPNISSMAGVGIINSYLLESNFVGIDKYIESMANLSGKAKARDVLISKLSIYTQLRQFDYGYKLAKQDAKTYANDKVVLYLYASLAALSNGHTKEAISLYKKYIKLNPKDAAGYNDLAYLLADKVGDNKAALNYAKKAYELSPKDAAVLDTLGWVHFKLKQYPEAESYIAQSYQILKDPETADHLRQVYLAEGKKDAAAKVIIAPNAGNNTALINKQMIDQSMLLLMYYQFGASFGK